MLIHTKLHINLKIKTMNYSVYCLHSKVIKFTGSLIECFNEFRNIGGYGIYNKTTGKTILYNPSNYWRTPERLDKYVNKGMKIYSSNKTY